MNNGKTITALIFICLVLGVLLYMKACKGKTPDHSAGDKKVDSLNTILKIHDSATFKVIDSVKQVAAVAIKAKDSLIKELIVIKGSLKGKDKDIAGLVEEINAAETARDTLALLNACDSLKMAYPIAKGLVTQYIMRNDSLITVNAQIITAKDTIISRLSVMLTETNNSLFEISRQYGNLSTDYKKMVKKAGRRFGVGPEVTIGIVNGNVSVVPGIGLHYTFIHF